MCKLMTRTRHDRVPTPIAEPATSRPRSGTHTCGPSARNQKISKSFPPASRALLTNLRSIFRSLSSAKHLSRKTATCLCTGLGAGTGQRYVDMTLLSNRNSVTGRAGDQIVGSFTMHMILEWQLQSRALREAVLDGAAVDQQALREMWAMHCVKRSWWRRGQY